MNELIQNSTTLHDKKDTVIRKQSDAGRMGAAEFWWMSGSAVVMGSVIYLLPFVMI